MNRSHFALTALLALLVTPLACGEVEAPPEELGYAYELVDASRCLERALEREADDRTRCRAVEVRPARDGCDCDGRGREPLDELERRRVRDAVERDPGTRGRGLDCMCELRQFDGARLTACRTDERSPLELSGERIDGWCQIGRELARECSELGRLRFEGDALLREDGHLFLGCLE